MDVTVADQRLLMVRAHATAFALNGFSPRVYIAFSSTASTSGAQSAIAPRRHDGVG